MKYPAALTTVLIFTAVFLIHHPVYSASEESRFGDCTIGVFGGSVTSDGRPLLWKNRDVTNDNQRFIYVGPYHRDGIVTIPYTGNVYSNDTARVYMGANAAGFAIMNSDSYNLNDTLSAGIDDGTLMRIALETCQDLEDFEALLDSTGTAGRKDCWNFGVLDASGRAALYECANQTYVRYDADLNEVPGSGYIVRANFSMSGGGSQTGLDRYKRAFHLVEDRLLSDPVDQRFILRTLMRDLANPYDDPYPLPYFRTQAGGPDGYIFNYGCTISNNRTSSASVIAGVRPGEDPLLTTIYALIGSPDLSFAYPLWVGAESVPIYLSMPDSTPMYSYCRARRSRLYDNPEALFYINSKALYNEFGEGIYAYTIPLEGWGIDTADSLLESWRYSTPPAYEFAERQFFIAMAMFAGFQQENPNYVTEILGPPIARPDQFALSNYPNPFNNSTVISYDIPVGEPVAIRIYDSLGRLVKSFAGTGFPGNSVIWSGEDMYGNRVKSGVYFYSLGSGAISLNNKMILLK